MDSSTNMGEQTLFIKRFPCRNRHIMKTKAFTLVELLVVVMIIALFVVFGAPAFNRYNHKQEVDTKAKEIKGVIDGAYVQSQYIQQGYDSALVIMNENNLISFLTNTNQCDINQLPLIENQIERVSYDNFKISYNIDQLGTRNSDDSILICFGSSGIARSFTYKNDLNQANLASVTGSSDIEIKASSKRYENSRPADQITFPYVIISGATNTFENVKEGVVVEIQYQ